MDVSLTFKEAQVLAFVKKWRPFGYRRIVYGLDWKPEAVDFVRRTVQKLVDTGLVERKRDPVFVYGSWHS